MTQRLDRSKESAGLRRECPLVLSMDATRNIGASNTPQVQTVFVRIHRQNRSTIADVGSTPTPEAVHAG
jgi:hypothetical protein